MNLRLECVALWRILSAFSLYFLKFIASGEQYSDGRVHVMQAAHTAAVSSVADGVASLSVQKPAEAQPNGQ